MGPVCEPGTRTTFRSASRLTLDTLREPPATNTAVFVDYLAFGLRRYLRTLPAMLDYRLEATLPALGVPVLVMRGGRDPIASAQWCRALAKCAANGRMMEVPGAPHVLQHTAPRATAEAVLRWSARLGDAAGARGH